MSAGATTVPAFAIVVASLLGAGCGKELEFYADGVRRAEGAVAIQREGEPRVCGERERGPWTYWFPNGERREQGTYERGRRVGEWTQWYPNGQRRSRGERVFDPALRASPREGVWTFWHENGAILARGTFVRGQREGHWDYSREDGSIDAEKTGEYHHDLRLD